MVVLMSHARPALGAGHLDPVGWLWLILNQRGTKPKHDGRGGLNSGYWIAQKSMITIRVRRYTLLHSGPPDDTAC